jgi:ribonuclease VapC
MTDVVLDASALLALLFDEPGAIQVAARLPRCLISAVNYAEVLTKSLDRGQNLRDAVTAIGKLRLSHWPLDAELAATAASLRVATREFGLSLADRCCLALALNQRLPVLTADRAWRQLNMGIDIEIIR